MVSWSTIRGLEGDRLCTRCAHCETRPGSVIGWCGRTRSSRVIDERTHRLEEMRLSCGTIHCGLGGYWWTPRKLGARRPMVRLERKGVIQ